MQSSLILIMLAVSFLLLTGCSPRYVVVTSDYAVYIAKTRPEAHGTAETLTFEDESGSEVHIPRSDVKKIREIQN